MSGQGCTHTKSEMSVGDPSAFADEMSKLVNTKAYSDIRFLVGEERQLICAHKCLLAARCEVFRAMFAVQKADEQPAPLVLTDIKPRTFLAILEFIYGNCCSLTPESVVDVMAASIEYGLDGLTKLCMRFMRNALNIDTVCEYLQAALTYNQTTLYEECLSFIERHTEEVFNSRSFNELSDDALAAILVSDRLKMDEGDILDKVTEWATVNSVVSGSSLGEVAHGVIQNVRFPLLDQEKLSQVELENRIKVFIPITLISGAWKYHALKRTDPRDPQTRPRAGTLPRESLRAMGLGSR